MICHTKDESAIHIASGCKDIAKKQKNKKNLGMMLLEKGFAWNFAKKCGIKCSKKWYQHMLKTVSTSANCNVKLVLHVEIDGNVSQNRPEITIKVKDARKWYFVDVMVP